MFRVLCKIMCFVNLLTIVNGEIISMQRNLMCHYVQCQAQSQNVDWSNYYTYNNSNFKFINKNLFMISFWAMIVNQNEQFILQINQNGQMLLNTKSMSGKISTIYYRLSIQYINQIAIPFPGMWVLYQFRLLFNLSQNRFQIFYIPANSYTQTNALISLIGNSTILFTIQNQNLTINLFQNQNSGPFVDKVANLKFADSSQTYPYSVLGDNIPDLLIIYLTFEEKILTQYFLDWTNNYYPMAGTSYYIDVYDPIINTTGVYVCDQQVITINNINLPSTFAISITFEIFNLTQLVQIISITDSLLQQTISVYVQARVVYVNTFTPTQNVTQSMYYCFEWNNNLNLFINLFQNQFSTKMALDVGCFYQYYINDRYYVLINPLNFNLTWKLTIGSINNLAGCQFIPKLFSISQGNKQVQPHQYNNCYNLVGGQCQTCYDNFVRQSDGICVPACNSTSYLQQVDPKVAQCRRTCHPTCSTCMEPNVCLTCDGIRINPPYCNCPPGYYDDKINPYCIKYFRIPDVQSGKLEYQCITGNYSVINNFPIAYPITPKVIISIDGIKQVGYGQFQIYVATVTSTSFTLTIFCAVDSLFQVSWLSESGNYIKSVSEQSNIQTTQFLNYTYQFPINQQSKYIAGLNGYLQPSFIISQGGDTQFINNSIIANMQSNTSQIDFQLVEYNYLQNFEFNISTVGVLASNYGTQGMKVNFSLQHVPTQAQFIFINKGFYIYQQILQFMTFQERLIDVIQVELIFDGFNPQLNLTWNILFGMVSCQNPIQPCNIEDYIINNCASSGGYYLDAQNTCQQCNSNCSTCVTDSVTCLTCQNNQILQSNQCVCPSDQYLEISTFICRDCDITCLTCSGPLQNNCLSCDIQRVFISEFLCICAEGYYSDSKLCPQCLPNCVTCSDGNSCLTCPQNSQLINSICICDDGYYLDIKKRQCSQCSNRCLTCSTLNTCIACNSVAYRIFKEGDCVCMDDYFENSSKQCKSCKDKSAMLIQSCNYKNCDDGVWTTAEGCDDGNAIDRDGCTKCEIDSGYKCVNNLLSPSFCYQCPTNCQSCQSVNKIVNCQLCNDGYFLSKNKCIKCGSNCKTCVQMNFCLTCYTIGKLPNDQGVCPTCEQTPGTYTVDGICVTKCGDGVLTENEECDDNNKVDGDGCSSSCQLEEGFSCINGQCTTKPQPIVQAQYVNTSSTNIIQIQSDVYIAKFCSLITAKVDGFGETDFTINVTKVDVSTCNVKFNYQKTILENNLIHIFYPSVSTNLRVLSNDVRELVVTPRRQIYYSQSQIASGQTVSSAQDTFSLFLYFIGPAAILLGGFNFFWTLLDILTWLNNLYYINVFFPANISLIFQQSAWASISLIPTIIQFNQPSDEYYRESPPRYMDKGVDPFFFNNTYQIAGIWGAALSFYFVSKFIISFSGLKKRDQKKQSAVALNQSSQFISRQIQVNINQQKQPLILQKILLFAQDYQQNVVAYLIKTLNLTFLDLVTAIILQLLFYDLNQAKNILVLINFICALVSIIVVIFTIYLAYNVSVQHKTLLKHKKQKLRYGSLYEGINIESQSGMMYAFVNLIRKTLFITFQIYYYSKPLFQTASCCFVSFLNVGFIVYANPFENVQVLLQNSIPDFCIFGLMLLCTILAIDDKIAVIDPNQRFNIGWLMLGFISLSILTQIIFLMKQFIENSFDNIKKASLYIKKLFN